MLLLGVDFETTGLDVTKERIIEIGAILWDTERHVPIKLMNVLVSTEVPVSAEITAITGITQDDVNRWGASPKAAFTELCGLMTLAKFIVAHNGNGFDRPLLEHELARHALPLPMLPWLDTSVDVPYPEKIKTRKLVHLAAEHGFVNPFAHRAVTDVLTMLRLLSLYDVEQVVKVSLEPSYTLAAETKKPWEDAAVEGKKETDKAKARGFRWDGARKLWLKAVKKSQLAAEQSHGEFAVRILEA